MTNFSVFTQSHQFGNANKELGIRTGSPDTTTNFRKSAFRISIIIFILRNHKTRIVTELTGIGMSIGNRLKHFIEINYKTQAKFAREIGVSRSALNIVVFDKSLPGHILYLKLYKAGVSIDWLISGIGSMFAKNETGKLLKRKNGEVVFYSVEGQLERIKVLIKESYESLDNLAEILGVKYDDLYEIIYFNIIPDLKIIEMLEKAGFHINWFSTKIGPMYTDNNFSVQLKSKKTEGDNFN